MFTTLALTVGHIAGTPHRHQSHQRCRTAACKVRVGRRWARTHPERHRAREGPSRAADGVITRLDLCVGNRENGEPGAYTYNTINWHAVNEYRGAYSFLPSTWEAAGGQRYAPEANEASPVQQSIVFNHWSQVDPGAWPNTLPACGGP